MHWASAARNASKPQQLVLTYPPPPRNPQQLFPTPPQPQGSTHLQEVCCCAQCLALAVAVTHHCQHKCP
jgi:hypothetical protein